MVDSVFEMGKDEIKSKGKGKGKATMLTEKRKQELKEKRRTAKDAKAMEETGEMLAEFGEGVQVHKAGMEDGAVARAVAKSTSSNS